LTAKGYAVPAIASSGAEAIEKTKEIQPDLVLMDIVLKGEMDGIKASEKIHALFDIPVIFLTAYADESVLKKAKITGPYGYILKPFEERELHIAVEIALYKHKYENKLKHAVEEWQATFDSMPYGVMIIDKKHNIIRANKYIYSLTGLSYEELNLQKCYKVLLGEDAAEKACPLPGPNDVETTNTFEIYLPKFGKQFLGYITPSYIEPGHAETYVLSLVDITESKEKEKSLIDSRNAFFNMLKDLDVSYKELKEVYEGLIFSLVYAIDAKSPWTKGHSERVTNYAVAIAKEMGLEEKVVENLHTASILHDIGKLGIYDVILDKPGKLTAEEFEIVKMHPAKGEEILKPIRQMKKVLKIVRHHHERIDGRGYPDGLTGEEIPLCARILYVADSFDAMTADRPYRPAPGVEYAISELKKYSGSQFDSKVVEAFLKVLENLNQ
jgi:PAS domain S-box-containing protein/putative nucleotidyltransferase with HDIG domain